MTETDVKFDTALKSADFAVAWSILLKEHLCSQNVTFMLSDNDDFSRDVTPARTISVDFVEAQTVEQLYVQIEEQRSQSAPIRPILESLSIRTHLLILHGNNDENNSVSPGPRDGPVQTGGSRVDFDVVCRILENGVTVEISTIPRSKVISKEQATRMSKQLESLTQQLSVPGARGTPLSQIQTASPLDKQVIWNWNSKLQEPVLRNAVEVFCEKVADDADALAISAWDGDFTYRDVDHLSNVLASALIQRGIKKGSIIPLHFEKSKWTPVAVLAVIKTGAAFVLLDEDLPLKRLKELLRLTGNSTTLTSPYQKHRVESLVTDREFLVIDHCFFLDHDSQVTASLALPKIEPTDPIYVVFTSGTTGVPKGATIRHSNICSFARLVGNLSGVDRNSRILSLASYAYDVSLGNIFLALLTGSCLCIPSSWECKNAVPGLIDSYQVTHVQTTPSVSKMFDTEQSSSLAVLDLCGEPCTEDALARWRSTGTRVMNTYSPAECTITSVLNPDVLASPRPSIIGKAIGACWITNPANYQRLTPVGGVGELLIEGPLVGAGYFNDPERTRAAFVEDPEWLLDGFPGISPGRRGRLYRTGDLARYTENGEIEILGRKDSQVKIRGQRVELGEVSAHLQQFVPALIQHCPEVVHVANGTELLLVFLVVPEEIMQDLQRIQEIVSTVDAKMKEAVPRSMVPSAYACIDGIPLSATGKTDHSKLKLIYESLPGDRLFFPEAEPDSRSLRAINVKSSDSISDKSKLDKLRCAWSEVFRVDQSTIRDSDTFFSLGGESLAAIKLVSIAARKGVNVDFATIFRFPRLSDLADKSRYSEKSSQHNVPPFALLDSQQSLDDLAAQCSTTVDNIADVYPCTALQEGLMLSGIQSSQATYLGRQVITLPSAVDVDRFVRAWKRVISTHAVLRTRIVDSGSNGLLQVVLKEDDSFVGDTNTDLRLYADRDDAAKMNFGDRLCRWTIVKELGATHFVLTMHHAIYDGWTLPRLGAELHRAYMGQKPRHSLGYNVFINYVSTLPRQPAEEYWANYLASPSVPSSFPAFPPSILSPHADSSFSNSYEIPLNCHDNISLPSLLRAAWGVLVGKLMGSQDVVFGSIASGRDVPIAGIEDLLAPTISTVPVRVKIDDRTLVGSFVQTVQDQSLEMMPYEHLGLQAIRGINHATRIASQFQTLFIVHPPSQEGGSTSPTILTQAEQDLGSLLGNLDLSSNLKNFNEYALMIMVSQKQDTLVVEFSFDSRILNISEIERLSDQLIHVATQLGHPGSLESQLADLNFTTDKDIQTMWEWNRPTCLENLQECVHDIIGRTMTTKPEAQAVQAWDGSLSYRELDDLSMRLAKTLQSKGIGPGCLIPICIEKSVWVPIAMIGIMRAGAGFVAMDVRRQPLQRLQTIVREAGASHVVTAGPAAEIAHKLSLKVINCDLLTDSGEYFPEQEVVSSTMLLLPDDCPSSSESTSSDPFSRSDSPITPDLTDSCSSLLNPADTAFVVFTSGSTGVPKGIKISHDAFCTTIGHHRDVLGLSESSRVYDFASYSFDIAVHNCLMTLALGGCLCVPSESDRENDIEGSLQRLGCNWANLTPSVARIIEPANVPNLKTLILAGEAVGQELILQWAESVRLINAYGPAECQICTVQDNLKGADDAYKIGRGVACATWIVDPQGDNLLPIGAVGELVIEGPILSSGYINTPSTGFVQDPSWLLRGSIESPGRTGTVYRTGDLARYLADGTIVYAGRITSQTKINGQRVELGDIEFHMQTCLPQFGNVVVEMITTEGADFLCAFVTTTSNLPLPQNEENTAVDTTGKLLVSVIEAPGDLKQLKQVLPSFMIPSTFLRVSHIPLTATGKVDRQKLREAASIFDKKDFLSISDSSPDFHLTIGILERLRQIWSNVLGLNPSVITPQSDFFELKGDSISAMRLVKACRAAGISLTVTDIFRHSRLHELCDVVVPIGDDAQRTAEPEVSPGTHVNSTLPFSMLPKGDMHAIVDAFAAVCNIQPHRVLDAYPCTPFQEALFAHTATDASAYVQHLILNFDVSHCLHRVLAAWDSVIASNLILRTRIVQSKSAELVQVVIRELQDWTHYESTKQYLENFRRHPMAFGSPLTRFGIVRTADRFSIVWTMHHAVYDSWTTQLILRQFSDEFSGRFYEIHAPEYNKFVKYIIEQEDNSRQWWRSRLEGASQATTFPKASALETPEEFSSSRMSRDIHLPDTLSAGWTPAELIRCAWAIIASRQTGCEKVLFGETHVGRNIPLSGIEDIRGPTVASVPILVDVRPDQTIASLSKGMREQWVEMQAFEHLGLQNIARISEECKTPCDFQTLLVVQDSKEVESTDHVFEIDESIDDIRNFNSYHLTIVFTKNQTSLHTEALFHEGVISAELINELLQQLEALLWSLSEAREGASVADLNVATARDLKRIWRWNAEAPTAVDRTMHSLVTEQALQRPDEVAILAHDGKLTYKQLNAMSSVLAQRLVTHGVGPGSFVPLVFEKSMWVPVAMMAVLKTGAAFSVLDVSHPVERLKHITTLLRASVVLSSAEQYGLACSLSQDVILVSQRDGITNELQLYSFDYSRASDPSAVMYVCFTSGSTGTPKGVMVTHRSLASAAVPQTHHFGFGPGQRVYDFSSHAFDAHIWHTWWSLISGACLCIPSNEDRLTNLAGSIDAFKSTMGFLTPSVARTINPKEVPTMRKLFLGGEGVTPWDVSLWAGHVELWGGYGPTEATPVTLFSRLSRPELASNIGRSIGVNTWICDPDDYHTLVAVGATGELVLEGAPVSLGYYGDAERTSQVFLKDPEFLGGKRSGRIYRTGDLVRYSTDGTIQYLGRADSQVKLRGQRVEFGEIEYHLKRFIPEAHSAVCEIVKHESGRQVLVAFCSLLDGSTPLDGPSVLSKLGRVLPSYMVPEALLVTESMPKTSSGKLDRRKLRSMAPDMLRLRNQRTLCATSPPVVDRQFTEAEVNLKSMWSICLNIPEQTINTRSHFFDEGGDSIAAMKLSNLARRQDLSLSVQAIMKNPQLCDMAQISIPLRAHGDAYTAFSLVERTNFEDLLAEAATICSTPTTSIEDIYPCSPLQTELFALTLKQPRAYVRQAVYEVPQCIDVAEVVRAWDKVVAAHPILRTRFIDIQGLGLLQVVLKHHTWDKIHHFPENLGNFRAQAMDLGSPLSRLAVCDDPAGPKVVWTVHHSLYDGWSAQIVEEHLRAAYHGKLIRNVPRYSSFIQHVISLDSQDAREFWKSRLEGCGEDTAMYPNLPPRHKTSQPTGSKTFKSTLNCKIQGSASVQAVIHAAWSLMVAQMTERNDIVFAATLAGRDAPVHGIETIVGPTIAPVPIRIRLGNSRTKTVQQLLDDIERDAKELAPYQHFGTRNIEAINSDTRAACQFRTLIVITPTRNGMNGDSDIAEPRIATYDDDENQGSFHTFPLVLFFDPSKDDIALEVVFNPLVLEEREVRRLSSRLECVISALNDRDRPIGEVDAVCEEDLYDIRRWTSPVPQPNEQLLHHIILKSAHEHSTRLAVDAWDGRLLYAELEMFSRALGKELRFNRGIGHGSVVPILSFKSRLVPVAALAILRIGATILPLDASWPVARLEAIIRQVQPPILLATEASKEQADALGRPVVFITDFCTETRCEDVDMHLDTDTSLTPDDLACVLFTSGSTGEPKGVMQTHRALSSAILYQTSASGITTETRAFEFASYAFDVSWNMIFKVFAVGGTLCVPSEEDRVNDLVGALNRFGATMTELTPSVASLIPGPHHIPYLRTLILSGEPVDLREFGQWKDRVQLIVCYGPSECTSVSTMNTVGDGCGIGRAKGCVTWLVNPEDHRRLVPVGVVGEILIEGPIVGSGYYGNDTLTASSYVSDLPGWNSPSGHCQVSERPQPAFKSGDLARYDFDGNLHFVSRKDTQAKLRGQRVELGDIQSHIHAALPHGLVGSVVACIIQAQSAGAEQRLAAFLVSNTLSRPGQKCELVQPSEDAVVALETMDDKLGAILPRYMLPSVYYFVNTVPHTLNGKIDRKVLARIAAQASPGQTYHGRPRAESSRQGTSRQVTGPLECRIQQWWAVILHREPTSIASSDNFFDLGGDSVSAMRLVGMARREGFALSVSDVFHNVTLSDLAEKVGRCPNSISKTISDDEIAPFSLLGESADIAAIRTEIAATCKLSEPSTIEDAYPCTPLQQSMLAATVREPGAFVSMRPYRIPHDVDFDRLKDAWDVVIQRHSILRTRLVDLTTHGLTQVVIREKAPWTFYSSMESFLEDSASIATSMCQGAQLMHLAVIRDPSEVQLVWIIHHAIYDGWILPMLDEEIKMTYLGNSLEAPYPGIRPLVKYLCDDNNDASISFWRKELQSAGDNVTSFPLLPTSGYSPKPVSFLEKTISGVVVASDATLSAFLYSTWSLLVSRLTGGNRVNFGAILTGRNAPVHDIDRMMGPTITTVPVVVDIDWSTTLSEFRTHLRNKTVGMIPHEHIGIQSIRRIEGIEAAACDFQTVLVIQPPPSMTGEKVSGSELVLMEDMDETSIPGFPDQHGVLNQYGLMIEIIPNIQGEITVRASFDDRLISAAQMDRIISQWSHIMQQLSEPASNELPLKALDFACGKDLADIWAWNEHVPAKIDHFIHDVITEVARLQPHALALDSWDGQLTYQELDAVSSQLAQRLVRHGVGPGCFVPLLFQKSLWANVSMLAVLKAGGAFVPLDADHPEGHLRSIMQTLNAKTILCSAQTRDRAARLAPHTLLVDETTRNTDSEPNIDQHVEAIDIQGREILQPESIAYAVFTSGSTGAAKGVKISHSNLATAIHHQAGDGGYELGPQTRSLDSSSYSFDACVCNFFYTVVKGGCLCVPSDESLKGDIALFMREYRVNWAQLVPSVARTVDSQPLPDLKRLVLTGEPMTRGDIDKWGSRLQLINAYGPTECTILCAISSPLQPSLSPGSRVGEVGRGKGANLWLTELGNPDRLAPVGAVGEVLIEGPLIGLGYLGPYKYPLCINPPWLLQGTDTIPGRQGALFRTGDQARYDADGNLIFLGRIGSEIKIRGQRVDLMGIEDAVRCSGTLPGIEVAAAIVSISMYNEDKKQMLLLFASDACLPAQDPVVSLEERVGTLAPSLKTALDNALPKYLQPEAFLVLPTMPKTSSGKTDRRRLGEVGKSIRLQQLIWINGHSAKVSLTSTPPTTLEERKLAELWADVLAVPCQSINNEDDFFQLGGDSLGVMRLTTLANARGVLLKPVEVFKNPRLNDLAQRMVFSKGTNILAAKGHKGYQRFCLIQDQVPVLDDFIQDCVVPQLGITAAEVEDIVPANGFQIDYIHNKEEPLGLQFAYLDIGPKVSWQRLTEACRNVVQSFQCLRARFVQHKGRYYQVILGDAPLQTQTIVSDEQTTVFSTQFCPKNAHSAKLTDVMTQLTLASFPNQGRRRVVLRMSHMQNDGWCTIRILKAIESAYNGGTIAPTPDWTSLLHCREQNADASRRYWQTLLQGSSGVTRPLIFKPRTNPPVSQAIPKVRTLRTQALPNFHTARDNRRTRPAIIINVAWALVLQQLLHQPGSSDERGDIVFGNVTTGRNGGGMPNLDSVIGPCVNMLPTRVQAPALPTGDGEAARQARRRILRGLVEAMAQQVDERSEFEGLDWDDVVKSCTAWPKGTRYNSAVHFRNMAFEPEMMLRTNDGEESDTDTFAVVWYELVAKPYWTTVLCYPEDDVLRLWLLADPDEISDEGGDELLRMLTAFVLEIAEMLDSDKPAERH